jgi:tRNA(Ile)-lysidine synthase
LLEARCESKDVAGCAREQGGNLEAIARRLRYEWLEQVANQACLAFVATGHTADDQAETVLFRLLRGTGLQGLSGIAPRRRLGTGVELIRPLLRVRRKEILGFLEAKHQDYCRDRMNLDRRYTRSRIRHELIPQLAEEYNPAIIPILGRLAEQAAAVYKTRQIHAEESLREIERARAGNLIILDRASLAKMTRHSLREALHFLWHREGWPTRGMGFSDWDRLAEVAQGEQQAVDLPEGLRARCVGAVVQIGRSS